MYDAQQHCWTWTLECGTPVHSFALQSDAQVTLKEGRGGVGILSTSPPDMVNGNLTIATMRYDCCPPQPRRRVGRCQESTSRVELRVYCPEGASGTLKAFVLPHLGIETCPVLTRTIKPLSLHTRTEAGGKGGPPTPCA